MGQRIALMLEGKMQMLTPRLVYNRPANVFTAKFIGSPSMNIVEASYTRGTLVIGRQVVWLPDMWSDWPPATNPAVCSWESARST